MQPFTSFFVLSLLISPLLAIPILEPGSPIDAFRLPKREDCSADTQKLIDGINSNIAVQKQEASQASVLASILSADTIDKDDFNSAKSKMLDIVNKGISIRKANQKITTNSNTKAGLAKVASAQAEELSLVKGLTADSDGAEDVKTLKKDFAAGIKQNQQNAKDAANGCTSNKRDFEEREVEQRDIEERDDDDHDDDDNDDDDDDGNDHRNNNNNDNCNNNNNNGYCRRGDNNGKCKRGTSRCVCYY